MKVVFNLGEDTTVVNDTIKVTCAITGVIGESNKEQIDERVRAVTHSMFPDADWAYANYSTASDGLTFRVSATTRVPTSAHERLDDRCEEASNQTTLITVTNIDTSIPEWQVREEESKLRLRIIDLAHAEAAKIGGLLESVEFFDGGPRPNQHTYAVTAMMDGFETKGLGQSAKLSLSAKVQVSCGIR